jgi:hypothetical protein
MKFDEASSYRIVVRWGTHLRRIRGAGGGELGWGGGIFLLAVAHGESKPRQVYDGGEGQDRVGMTR